MSKLYIFRGLPGSGKSTAAKMLGIPHAEADMFFMRDGQYVFDASLLGAAHAHCKRTVELMLDDGDAVVSNTFTTMKELKPYLELAAEKGVEVEVRRFTSNYGSVHNVPEEAMTRMRNRMVDFPGEKLIK